MQVLKKLFLANREKKNNTRENKFISNPLTIVFFLVFTVFLLLITLYPLLVLFLSSIGIRINNIEYDLSAYYSIFSDIHMVSSIVNTLYLAFGVTFMTLLIGGGLAWLVTRTDLPYKNIINRLIFLTHIVPSYIMAVAWIELLGRSGIIRKIFINKLSLNLPFEIYSLKGVIFVMGIHLYPLIYMAVRNALLKTDSSLEKAALMSGASRFRIFRTITIPLISPSIYSICLFVFSRTISCFGVAAILALPVRKYVLTTYIYTALNSLNLKQATAISVILILFSGGLFLFQTFRLNKRNYTLFNMNSTEIERVSLGKYRKKILFLIFIFFIITLLLPLIIIVFSSLLKSWGSGFILSNISLGNYIKVLFEEELTVRAIRNSIIYGLIAATIAVILGTTASYLANRTNFKGRGFLELTAAWPMAVPTTVMSVAAILAWINPPFKLYNTPWIIIVTYIAVCLPFVVKNVSGLIQNLDPELEQMARVSGASYLKTYRDITIPLIKPGMRTAWILSLLFALREIPISVMLYASGTETIGVLLFNLRSDTGGLEMTSTIAVIVISLTIMGHILLNNFSKMKWR